MILCRTGIVTFGSLTFSGRTPFTDDIIALAYCTISLKPICIFRKRKDFRYIWMLVLFEVFILGCGIAYIFDVIGI